MILGFAQLKDSAWLRQSLREGRENQKISGKHLRGAGLRQSRPKHEGSIKTRGERWKRSLHLYMKTEEGWTPTENRKQKTKTQETRETRQTDWLSGTTLTSGLWFCSNCSLSAITVTFLFTVSAFISLLPPSGDQWRLIYSHLILVGKVPTALYSRYDGLAS